MKSTHIKTISTALLTLLVLSILPATVLLIKPTYAQGTIEFSSDNLHPYKVIEIKVTIPGLDVPSIDLRLIDAAGQPVKIVYRDGTEREDGVFKARRVGVGIFYAYIGGDQVNLAQNPAYPKYAADDNIVKLAAAQSAGATLTVEALGYGISKSFTYNTVKPVDLVLDRDVVPARRTGEYTVKLTLTDQDLNLDPTKVDDLSTYPVGISVTWISATTGVVLYKTITKSGATIRESAVNSGRFTVSFNVDEITPPGAQLGPGDIFLLDVYSDIGVLDDNAKYVTTKLTVVYRYPEISIDFTQQGITVYVKSPDDNVNTGAADTLDPSETVSIIYGTTSCSVPGSGFSETGKNTGVFKLEIPVEWGSTTSLSCSPLKFTMGVDTKSFTISAEYLDITGSGTYVTKAPIVEVVKQSPVSVELKITDPDLNIDPESIDRLTADVDTTNDVIEFKDTTGLTLYRISFRKPDGTTLDIPVGYTGPVFFETDFDSGIFRVVIPSESLFEPGKSYTIVIKDHTGGYTVSVPITITPIEIRLDRTSYPINRDKDVVVYITYVDDRYNLDAKRIDSVSAGTLKYNITNPVTGETIVSAANVGELTETAPNSGVFTGKITVSANTPKFIDAVITVYSAADPKVKATATFKVYQLTPTDLKVEPATINMTGCFTITVNDPDANVDSAEKDKITVVVAGVGNTATETGPNTGIFTASVCARDIAGAKPSSTITVKYTEKTPPLAPTAHSFAGSEYDITATVRIVSFSGSIEVPKDWIGPYETMTLYVVEPDLNLDPELAESRPGILRVTVEGRVETWSLNGVETGVNTGKFKVSLNLPHLLTGQDTPPAKDLAPFIGRRITLVYYDEADATGARATVVRTLTIRAVDAKIVVDKEAVNVGDTLEITIENEDIAQNPAPAFRMVTVRSTTYPAGISLYASEVEPGVYKVAVRVVSLAEWVIGAPQIPAKLGDTIEILYRDPIAADGTEKLFTKSIAVGVFVEMPGRAEKVVFVDVVTGQAVTPKVGREVFLTVTLRNTDIVERGMTAIVVVRDPAGVAVARFATAVTLGAGASTEVSFGWTPIVSGSHTVEVYIVKSLADRTPMGEPAAFSIGVEA